MKKIDSKIQPKFFDLLEFVDKIKLSNDVLFHLTDVNKQFEQYLKLLGEYAEYDEFSILFYWLNNTQKELVSSGKVECSKFLFTNEELLKGDLFFEKLNITPKGIKDIHRFVCEHSKVNNGVSVGEYRKQPVWRGNYLPDGKPNIKWWGVNPDDIEKFIKSYIDFYKYNSLKEIYSSPFLKAALAHILLLRIQPFGDGNSRTSRIIHNISFTSSINKIYGTKLKVSPLNISKNIYVNKKLYRMLINNISFDSNQFDNDTINDWLDFILDMYEEELYFQTDYIPGLAKSFETIKQMAHTSQDEALEIQKVRSLVKKLF